MLIKIEYFNIEIVSCLKHSNVVSILLINVKMPTIVGILTFLSRINFILNSAEFYKPRSRLIGDSQQKSRRKVGTIK